MNKPVVFLKAHVGTFTRKDGAVVQAHDTKVTAATRPAPAVGEIGHHEHSTYGVHFQPGDYAKDSAGNTHKVLSHSGSGVLTESGGTYHPTKLKPVPAPAGKPGLPTDAEVEAKGVHHKDLREGDEIQGPDGTRHEYSHTQQGLGRKVVHTASGHTLPTGKDGHLAGFKKTGTNFADPAPAAKPKAAPVKRAAPKAKPSLDAHPNVIGKAEKGDKRSMHFDGKQYHATGKTGHSFHDQTPVAEYEHPESGHRVWRDGQDRVHADSHEEAKLHRGK